MKSKSTIWKVVLGTAAVLMLFAIGIGLFHSAGLYSIAGSEDIPRFLFDRSHKRGMPRGPFGDRDEGYSFLAPQPPFGDRSRAFGFHGPGDQGRGFICTGFFGFGVPLLSIWFLILLSASGVTLVVKFIRSASGSRNASAPAETQDSEDEED